MRMVVLTRELSDEVSQQHTVRGRYTLLVRLTLTTETISVISFLYAPSSEARFQRGWRSHQTTALPTFFVKCRIRHCRPLFQSLPAPSATARSFRRVLRGPL